MADLIDVELDYYMTIEKSNQIEAKEQAMRDYNFVNINSIAVNITINYLEKVAAINHIEN